jgi:hypothetical protein
MAEELLDRVVREIRERRAQAQAAYEESRQLERALRALDGQQDRPVPAGQSARRARASRPSRSRAPRGQTRAAILQVVAERPGTSAAEIAGAAGLERGVTQTTLGRLVHQGAVERVELPSGTSGYRLSSPTPPAPAAADEPDVELEPLDADAAVGDVSAAKAGEGDPAAGDEPVAADGQGA